MKKLLFLIAICLITIQIQMVYAENLTMDKAVQFASGIDKALNYPEESIIHTK